MNGKLSSSLNAGKNTQQTHQDSAAFAKLRHLENRMNEVETDLNNVEQQVTENTNALTNLSENVTTKNVTTNKVSADVVTSENIVSGNVNSMNVDADTVTSDKVNANNIEVTHSVYADTVDVEKSIANVGQFVETHTITANNTTTNSETLNVATTANLTGQVNVDGDMTFTKDNGLSKLQGQYLEIDAANVVITNDKKDKLALYVPGENGAAVFGGSITSQDTIAAKNLIITDEAHIKGLNVEGLVLDNPTIKNIKGTDELTTTALVLDNDGKLVVKKVANEVPGAVANALYVKKEKNKTYQLADEWAADENVRKVPVSSNAQFVYYANTNEYYLTNKNGDSLKLDNFTTFNQAMTSLAHKNFVYIFNIENNKCEVERIDTNNMAVGPKFDITQYVGNISSLGDSSGLLFNKILYQPVIEGAVLNDDIPTVCFIGTSNYLDLTDMTVKTRDVAFNGNNTYILTRSGNWLELTGNLSSEKYYLTNGKYSSVEDTALGTAPSCADVNETSQLYYIDAPVYGGGGDGKLLYVDGGILRETPLTNIPGYKAGSGFFGTIDTDDNIIGFYPDNIIIPGAITPCNIYTYGYYPREYFSVTVYYTDLVTIDKNKVEVYGKTFYTDGEWYDVIVENVTELLEFIKKPKDSKRYKVLYKGKDDLIFDTSDTNQFPMKAVGSFDIYNAEANGADRIKLKLGGTPGTSNKIAQLMYYCHWYGFDTEVSLVLCRDNTNGLLQINDCSLSFNTVNAVPTAKYYLGIGESNNVTYNTVDIPRNLFLAEESTNNKLVDVYFYECHKVLFKGKEDVNAYKYRDITFYKCSECEANVTTDSNLIPIQYGPGANVVYNSNNGRTLDISFRQINSIN